MSTLLDLQQGESGIIVKVKGRGAFRKRITEMGFVRGKEVTVIKSAPLMDPVEYKLMGYNLSLRRSEAELIEVIPLDSSPSNSGSSEDLHRYQGTFSDESIRKSASERGQVIDVALIGNPNCGKTTLFNIASGSREHVGNFSGVTVDSKTAVFRHNGYRFNLTDLPGTYSLTAYTPEELYIRRHILEKNPDVVVNVIDASNLERNLYLTTQLIDMDIRVVIALNMYDEMTGKGDVLDYETLSTLFGIPVIPTVGSRGTGITELFSRIIGVYEEKDQTVRHVHINYGDEIEKSIRRIQDKIWEDKSITDRFSSRYFAIKLLEKDPEAEHYLSGSAKFGEISEIAGKEIQRLEKVYDEDSSTLITDAKYGFITGALKETYRQNIAPKSHKTRSEKIDGILTHRYLGFPIFLLFLWIMFQSTFVLGGYPQEWIEMVVEWFGGVVSNAMPDGSLKDLLVDGIISGVGSVIVFLPNILILFLFISFMEDSGYMARAAFIMDKLMHKIGLHGQSFIPLIMGFGCNVPAIMTTRTLKDRNDRLLTMLINPFMSCSARLPVYILIVGTVFPDHAGTVIFGLYMTGIILAILIAMIFKNTIFRRKHAPFVMELPPYRFPTYKVIFRHMWNKGQEYLKKMGGVILIAVIIIWALEYFPAGSKSSDPVKRFENSYIARIGKTIEPVLSPLGFDWKMGVSLITGAAAKEVVVSTMGVLYDPGNQGIETSGKSLQDHLKAERYQEGARKGELVFTPLAGISFLLFILIYMPCVAVVATVRKESGSWKWAVFLITYTTGLAWLLSFAVFQTGSLFIQ